MEGNYLQHVLPFLSRIEPERRQQFETYFRTAPIWLLESFQVSEVDEGTVLLREGEPVHTVYLIGSGIIKATDYRVYGIPFDFMRFGKVYAFGGMEILMELDRYQTTLQTITQCTVLKIPQEMFKKWICSDTAALWNEAHLVAEYLLEEARISRAFLFLQGSNRLAMLLTAWYDQYARDGVLRIKSDRQELSDSTGLCLKTITRSVKKFCEEGLLTKEKGMLTVDGEQYDRLKCIVAEILEND